MDWIDVKNKLPKDDNDVLIFNPKDGIGLGCYNKNDVHSYIENDGTIAYCDTGWESYYDWAPYMSPTHWTPLPEPPEVL